MTVGAVAPIDFSDSPICHRRSQSSSTGGGGGVGGSNGGSGGSGGGGGGGDSGKGSGDNSNSKGSQGGLFAGLLKGWEERVQYDSEFPVKVFIEQVRRDELTHDLPHAAQNYCSPVHAIQYVPSSPSVTAGHRGGHVGDRGHVLQAQLGIK